MIKRIIICFLILFIANKVLAQGIYTDEMIQLTEAVNKSQLSINKWQITIKEHMNKEELEQIVAEMENSYLVTRKEDQYSIKYSISNTQKTDVISVSYNALLPKNMHDEAQLIAVIAGEGWNRKIEKKYVREMENITKHYFTQRSQLFTCLTTSHDGIIESDYVIEKLTNELNIQQITTQNDRLIESVHRKILYGYSPKWGNEIVIDDIPTNIQIVDKTDGTGNGKIVIGTPILINEY